MLVPDRVMFREPALLLTVTNPDSGFGEALIVGVYVMEIVQLPPGAIGPEHAGDGVTEKVEGESEVIELIVSGDVPTLLMVTVVDGGVGVAS